MYMGGAGAATLESRDLGSLGDPFPPDVEAFLEEVRKNPKKFERLLMSVSNKLITIPEDMLAVILAGGWPKAKKAVDGSSDPAGMLKDLRMELGIIRLTHANSDQRFRHQFDALIDLSNRVDTNVTCVITWRRLRKHFPRPSQLPMKGTLTRIRRLGRDFLVDPEFRRSFPKLSREIRASIFPELIHVSTGLFISDWALLNKQDHEGFKKRAQEDCKARRDAEKAQTTP